MEENKSLVERTNDLQLLVREIDDYLESDKEVPSALAEQLQGMLTAHKDKVDRCAAFVKRADSTKSWLQEEKKRIDFEIKRLDRGVKRMKELASMVMDSDDVRKLDGSRGHYFSKLATFAVEVVNENMLPDEYWVIKKTPDKAKIKRDLTNGREVPGARLIQYDTVQVR